MGEDRERESSPYPSPSPSPSNQKGVSWDYYWDEDLGKWEVCYIPSQGFSSNREAWEWVKDQAASGDGECRDVVIKVLQGYDLGGLVDDLDNLYAWGWTTWSVGEGPKTLSLP